MDVLITREVLRYFVGWERNFMFGGYAEMNFLLKKYRLFGLKRWGFG